MSNKKVIFFDDEPQTNKKLKNALLKSGFDVAVPKTIEEAFWEINHGGAEVIIHCGHHTQTYWEIITAIMEKHPQFPSLYISVSRTAEEFHSQFKGPFHQKLRPLSPEKIFINKIKKLFFLSRLQKQNMKLTKKLEFHKKMESLFETVELFDFKQKMTLLFHDIFKCKNVLFIDQGEFDIFLKKNLLEADVVEINQIVPDEYRVIAAKHTTMHDIQKFLKDATAVLPQGWQQRKKSFFTETSSSPRFVAVPISGPQSKKILGHIFLIEPDVQGDYIANSLLPYLQKTLGRHAEHVFNLNHARSLSYIDDVTDLYNQRYLKLVLDKEINRAQRTKDCFSVLFMDIDHFKRVNDTRGHLVGSKVLVELSKIIHENIRTADYGFRYGGDEFLVLLVGTNSEHAKMVAERMRKQVEESVFDIEGIQLKVTLSIGIASFPEHATTKEQIIELADQAMYVGKKKSRNIVYVAS